MSLKPVSGAFFCSFVCVLEQVSHYPRAQLLFSPCSFYQMCVHYIFPYRDVLYQLTLKWLFSFCASVRVRRTLLPPRELRTLKRRIDIPESPLFKHLHQNAARTERGNVYSICSTNPYTRWPDGYKKRGMFRFSVRSTKRVRFPPELLSWYRHVSSDVLRRSEVACVESVVGSFRFSYTNSARRCDT